MPEKRRFCIVWGATGQSKVVYDILLAEDVQIVHFFENNQSQESPLRNVPISYGEEGLVRFVEYLSSKGTSPDGIDCIAAIGGEHGKTREYVATLMTSYGFRCRRLIHQRSIVSPLATLGAGVQILAGAIIGPFASIGSYSIINSGANVDHDSVIGRCCHLAPMAALAGNVIVEDNVFIGTNATVLPRIRIGSDAVVGAGAVVTKDVSALSVVAGNPARAIVN